jgi:hypothetical protein
VGEYFLLSEDRSRAFGEIDYVSGVLDELLTEDSDRRLFFKINRNKKPAPILTQAAV